MGKAIRNILDKFPFDDSKTYLIGILMILTGVGGIGLYCLSPEAGYGIPPAEGWQLILAGLGLLGIGHKVDKARRLQ